MDIDFDELLVSSKPAATKPSKFAPKNSKFKPVAKPKLEPKPPLITPSQSNTAAVPKVELDDPNPPPPPSAQFNAEITVDNGNGSVDMDTEPMDIDLGNDLLHEEEEEDPVVREIDVLFSSSVDANSKLYVLQYPLRPCWRPYELEETCEKVRVKPETAEVELEMSVQVDSENYDADDDKSMPKQVLASAWQPPTSARYAVGILIGNELHLNSVHAVVQLRPSMQHLKRQHPSKEMIASADIKKEKAVKQPLKQSKQPGVINEQNTDAKEQWVPLNYHGEASLLSRQYMGNMVAQQTSQIHFTMSQSDYIDSLCPATSNKVGLGPKLSSRSALLKLPLDERYKTQFLEGPPVHRFNSLKHIAPNDSDEDIFKVLQTHAHLVQGLWVAKSRLKYGRDGGKEVLLRNYVMLQFSKSPIFQETQFPKSTQVSESMKGILDEFATRRDSCRDWKFKECTDDSFIKEYSKIVNEQKKIWDQMEKNIIEALFPKNLKHSIGDRRPISNNTNDVKPKTTNVPPSASSTLMLEETREALPRALQKLFQSYKVCSLNQIRQKLRDMAVSESTLRKDPREARAAAAAADAAQEELLRTLNQVAVDIHGSYVSKSSPDHPQYDQLRKIVIDLFLAAGPDGKLKKATIFEAGNVKLQRQITSVEYQKVLNELCISRNSAWVLKSGDSPT